MGALEQQMTAQARALETLGFEKSRLEQELLSLKASGGTTGGGPDQSALLAELKKKIKDLEDRLAEYSVIEDDLANLKRLQQENAQLKASLAGGGGAAAVAGAASPAPATAAAPSTPEPPITPDPLADIQLAPTSTEAQASDPFAAAEPPVASPTAEAAAPETPAAPPSTGGEKSEADLVAEFEKLLGN
jgi:TolA-binding protein